MRLRRLAGEIAPHVRVTWRAFPIVPEPRPGRLPDDHTREVWRQAAETGEGVRFAPWPDDVPLPAWSFPALETARWVEATRPEAAEMARLAILEAYFGRGTDIADPGALVGLVDRLGLDGPGLAAALGAGAYRRGVVEEYASARAAGIDGVPTVVLTDGRGAPIRVVGEVPYAQYRRLAGWFLAT